jgi:hypothetical protein
MDCYVNSIGLFCVSWGDEFFYRWDVMFVSCVHAPHKEVLCLLQFILAKLHLNHDLLNIKAVAAYPDFLLLFPVAEHSIVEDSKPLTGWSMTSEVVTGLDLPADFMVRIKPDVGSKGTQKRKTSEAHGRFPCERCGRSYFRKDSLRRHLQWECGKEPTFQCPFCPQRYKRKAHQIHHVRRQHGDKVDYVNVEVKSEVTDVTNG